MKRKSQIAIILVLVVVIVLGIGIFYMLNSKVNETRRDTALLKVENSGLDVSQVKKLGDNCLKSIVEESLKEIYSDEYLFGTDSNLTSFFMKNLTNTINSGAFIKCFNYSYFEMIGYEFNVTIISSNLAINLYDITLFTNYPMKITYRASSATLQGFNARVNSPLGALINSAQLIINDAKTQPNLNITLNCDKYTLDSAVRIKTKTEMVNITKDNRSLVFNFTKQLTVASCP